MSISRSEWRRVAVFTALFILLTSAPYWLAWARAGAEWHFSGFLFGADDGYSYLGKMRLGARGLWDFYLFYTSEPHASAPLIFLPYILPGQIVRLFTTPDDPALAALLAGVFGLLRVIFDALLIAALYRFIAAFVELPAARFRALLLATLGGGLGWLLALGGELPPEFYIPEGFSFLILWGLPHLALARAALLSALLLILYAARNDEPSRASKEGGDVHHRVAEQGSSFLQPLVRFGLRPGFAALCLLVVGLCVPFYLVIIYIILAVWGLAAWIARRRFPWPLARAAAFAALPTLPLFAYYALVFSRNPAFAQWSAQNLLPSPAPMLYLLAYALLLIPAGFALRAVWARRDLAAALLLGWPLVVPLLVYLPFNVQRRLSEAVIVPLAILAALGLERWSRRIRPVWLLLASLSSAFLLFGGFLVALNPRPPLFRPAAEVAALNWLNANAAPDSVALSSFETGNVLPAYTNLRPFVGHGPETLFALDKNAVVERFFSGAMPQEERAALYAAFGIRCILYGQFERALSAAPDAPGWAADAELAYEADGYQLYLLMSRHTPS